MAAPKRSPAQIEKDRAEIAKRILRGETQTEIAKSIGISQQQISYDMRIVRQRWKESQIDSVQAMISQQIAEINEIKREAWLAWAESKTLKAVIVDEKGTNGKGDWEKVTTKREKLNGNPAYLNVALNCVNQIAVLLNLPTELKYQDINAAISKVTQAGYEVREQEEQSPGADAEL